jgi:hypothetical protein
MFHTLPDSIKMEIFEWDSTYRSLFRLCLEEIECRISKQLSMIYHNLLYPLSSPVVPPLLGYFQFKYTCINTNDAHIVFIHEGTSCWNDTQYILQDWNMTKGLRRTRFLYL